MNPCRRADGRAGAGGVGSSVPAQGRVVLPAAKSWRKYSFRCKAPPLRQPPHLGKDSGTRAAAWAGVARASAGPSAAISGGCKLQRVDGGVPVTQPAGCSLHRPGCIPPGPKAWAPVAAGASLLVQRRGAERRRRSEGPAKRGPARDGSAPVRALQACGSGVGFVWGSVCARSTYRACKGRSGGIRLVKPPATSTRRSVLAWYGFKPLNDQSPAAHSRQGRGPLHGKGLKWKGWAGWRLFVLGSARAAVYATRAALWLTKGFDQIIGWGPG